MGHRSNFVIIEQGKIIMRYSHWGAITIPQDIFWGPEKTIEYINRLEPCDELLDNVWCEGAVLVDLDKKNLLFYGGEDIKYSPALQRNFLRIIAENWPGWKIDWAYQEIIDIAAYLNIDLAQVKSSSPANIKPLDLEALAKDNGEYISSVISLVSDYGQVFDYGFEDLDCKRFLYLGPYVIEFLKQRPTIKLPHENNIINGILIDNATKQLWVWCKEIMDDNLMTISSNWLGWQVKRHYQGLPYQVELTGRSSDEIKVTDEQALATLKNILSTDRRFDPSSVLKAIMQDKPDAKLELNPHFFSQADVPVNKTEKESIIKKIFKIFKK
jgi:hypothetical protein